MIKSEIKNLPQFEITEFDSRLFGNLIKANRPLPVKRLAQRLHSSWKTTNNHVTKLEKANVLITNRSIRRTNVSVDPDILRDLELSRKNERY